MNVIITNQRDTDNKKWFSTYKVKLQLTLLVFITFSTISNITAQQTQANLECGTLNNKEQFEYMQRTKSLRESISLNKLAVTNIPVTVHLVVNSINNPGVQFSQTDVDTAIDQLNNDFAQVGGGLYFEQCGTINYISEQEENINIYPNARLNTSSHLNLWRNNVVDNSINIFFVSELYSVNGKAKGYATYPSDLPDKWVFVDVDYALNGGTLSHEVGHYFNLLHTFARGNELVSRTGPGNCGNGIGDDLCDTKADPENLDTDYLVDESRISTPEEIWKMVNCSNNENHNTRPCRLNNKIQYGCVLTDENGHTYFPDPRNIMSYGHPGCRDVFSLQQIWRMAFALVFDRPELLSNNCNSSRVSKAPSSEINGNSNLAGFQVYPNQFSDYANVEFDIKKDGKLKITLLNLLGGQSKEIVGQANYKAGKHQITIDGSDLPSGVYYCLIESDEYVEARKIVVSN